MAADAEANDEEIAISVEVGGSNVDRTKRRFVLCNQEAGAHGLAFSTAASSKERTSIRSSSEAITLNGRKPRQGSGAARIGES